MASGTQEKKPTKCNGKEVMEKFIEYATHVGNENAKQDFYNRKEIMEKLVELSEAGGYYTEKLKRIQTVEEETEDVRRQLLAIRQ